MSSIACLDFIPRIWGFVSQILGMFPSFCRNFVSGLMGFDFVLKRFKNLFPGLLCLCSLLDSRTVRPTGKPTTSLHDDCPHNNENFGHIVYQKSLQIQ